jgi:hypothetical protein
MIQSFPISRKSLLSGILITIISLAALKVSYELWQMIFLEVHGAINPDAFIYLTIGKGILHGSKVYVDLFESKPPGVFYLSAISLFFGGTVLMRSLEVISLLLIPFSLTILGWKYSRLLALISFCFGGLLSLWIQQNGGGLQTEIFSLLFAVLYVLNIQGRTWPRIILKGFLLMMVLAFREPFLLGILAASLLISRTWKDFLLTFILPLFIAILMGTIVLLAMGILSAFTQIYLPAMFLSRIQGGVMDPLYIRMLWIHRLFSSLTIYSSMPLLGYALGSLWLLAVISKVKLTRIGTITVLIAAIFGLLLIHEYFVLFQLLQKTGSLGISPFNTLFDRGFITTTITYAIGTLLYIGLLFYINNFRILMSLGCGLLAILCLSLAVGIGGYTWNYMLFIFPAVIVTYFFFLESSNKFFLIPFTLLLCIISFTYYPTNRFSMTQYAQIQTLSSELDQIMDHCGYDRYAMIGSYSKFAFAKHMPIGPMFAPYFQEYLGLDDPLYLKTYDAIDKNAKILLQQDPLPTDPYPLPESLRNQFVKKAPSCAKDLTVPSGFKVLYRA